MLQSSPSSLSDKPLPQPSRPQSRPRPQLWLPHKISINRWGFLRNVAVLSGGTALAQALNIALSPIITRLYTPANMGQLALFTSFLSFFLVGTSLKYELGIASPKPEREPPQLAFFPF